MASKLTPCPVDRLIYSDKYTDDAFEYRHIIMPKEYAKHIPRNHLMTETEWRGLGIAQSPGWIHYMLHGPEPNILMFRKPLAPTENQENKPTFDNGSSRDMVC